MPIVVIVVATIFSTCSVPEMAKCAMSSKPCIPMRQVLFSSFYSIGTTAQKDEVTCPSLNNL